MQNSDKNEANRMASEYGKEATDEDINKVSEQMDGMKRGPLALVWDKVTTIWNGFLNPETPTSIKAMLIGSLIYMISPIDLIPDFIPILGLTDDAAVIGIAFNQFMNLGIFVAATAAIIEVTTYIVDKINNSSIGELLKANPDAISAQILKCTEDENFYYVNVGLYDENENKLNEVILKSREMSEEIFENEVLELQY